MRGENESVDQKDSSGNPIKISEVDIEHRIVVLSKIQSLIMWAYEKSGSFEKKTKN